MIISGQLFLGGNISSNFSPRLACLQPSFHSYGILDPGRLTAYLRTDFAPTFLTGEITGIECTGSLTLHGAVYCPSRHTIVMTRPHLEQSR